MPEKRVPADERVYEKHESIPHNPKIADGIWRNKEKVNKKSGDKKVTKKTQMQYDKILAFMEEGKHYGIWDFCELLKLKESRTKVILQSLSDYIEVVGSNRDRRYKKRRISQ